MRACVCEHTRAWRDDGHQEQGDVPYELAEAIAQLQTIARLRKKLGK